LFHLWLNHSICLGGGDILSREGVKIGLYPRVISFRFDRLAHFPL